MTITFSKVENDTSYFIRERDCTSVKTRKDWLGTFWLVKRYIHRVGYMFEPKLHMPDEVIEEAKKLLYDSFLGILPFYFDKDPGKSGQIAKRLVAEMSKSGYPLPEYKARGSLTTKKRREVGEDAEWRRFWFRDIGNRFPYHKDVLIELVDTKRYMTGKWFPPSSGYSYGDWGEEYDYEPGGLDPGFHQTVYLAKRYMPLTSGWMEEGDYGRYQAKPIMIHPWDLIDMVEVELSPGYTDRYTILKDNNEPLDNTTEW